MTLIDCQICKGKIKQFPQTNSAEAQALHAKTALTYQFSFSFAKLADDWGKAAPPKDIFLSLPYLEVLEKHAPKGMKFLYIVFYKNRIPVGVAYGQFHFFVAKESIPIPEKKDASLLTVALNKFKRLLLRALRFETLYLGNLLATGDHGFYFNPKAAISKQQQLECMQIAINEAVEQRTKSKKVPSVLVLKDIQEENRLPIEVGKGFKEFTIQPAMRFFVHSNWNSFEDYSEALYSKYRIRAKRARKKKNPIKHHFLSLDFIRSHQDELQQLYEAVIVESDFLLFKLDFSYFIRLKESLGEKFQVLGYFLNGQLVGFVNLLENFDELDAHFIGFKQELNSSHQLYLNMLLDMIEYGINSGAKSIHFARTALEIKSSVGAIPEDLFIYARHRCLFPHLLMKPLFGLFNPSSNWTPRNAIKS